MPIIDNREIVLDVLDKLLPLCAKHSHPRVELSPPPPIQMSCPVFLYLYTADTVVSI